MRAIERGLHQLGTLGSGNHYLEVQVIPPGGIHDPGVARVFGVREPGQVLVMLHVVHRLDISRKVVSLRPIGNITG